MLWTVVFFVVNQSINFVSLCERPLQRRSRESTNGFQDDLLYRCTKPHDSDSSSCTRSTSYIPRAVILNAVKDLSHANRSRSLVGVFYASIVRSLAPLVMTSDC